MRGTYYQVERSCEECGSRFWGTAGANFCSSSCRSRNWRAQRARTRGVALAALCSEIAATQRIGSAAYSKLLIRLLRLSAAELRQRGWDPFDLLRGTPEEPIELGDQGDGGVEGVEPKRTRWVNTPKRELKMLERTIARREGDGRNVDWYVQRRDQLLEKMKKPNNGLSR